MNKVSAVTSYLIRKLWLLTVVCLVFMALSISLMRLSLPYLNDYRAQIQGWAKENYDVKVHIGNIDAEWRNFGPSLVVNDIKLLQGNASPLELTVDKVHVDMDFWQTLLQRQFISQTFVLEGGNVTVQLDRLNASSTEEYPIVNALQELFLTQITRFKVENSRLKVEDNKQRIQTILVDNLSWLNKDDAHQGIGEVRVEQLAKNSFEFILDIEGEPGQLAGQLYSKATEFNVSPWVSQVLPEASIQKGYLNFETWLSFSPQKLDNMVVKFGDNQLIWEAGEQAHQLSLSNGDLILTPSATGWLVNSHNIQLTIDQQTIDSLAIELDKTAQGYTFSSAEIPLSKLLPLASLTTDAETYQQLSSMNIDGVVSSLVVHQTAQGLYWQADLEQLGWQKTTDIPGVSELTVAFNGGPEYIAIEFKSFEQQLLLQGIMPQDLHYQELSGELLVTLLNDGVLLESKALRFLNDDFELSPTLSFDSRTNEISLLSNLPQFSIEKALTHLPLAIGTHTQAYLKKSLKQGRVGSGDLLIQGNLANYPFENNDGLIQIGLSLKDIGLAFSSEWPALTEADIDLTIENERLDIHTSKARLLDIQNVNAAAVIPSLSADNPILNIDAEIQAPAKAIHQVMSQSMLSDSVGAAMDELVIQGDVKGEFKLVVDLNSEQANASGKAFFAENDVYITTLEETLEKVNGTLLFNDEVLASEELTASLWGMPLAFSVDSKQVADDYQVRVKSNGRWQSEDILTHLPEGLDKYLSGTLGWKALLDVSIAKSDFNYRLHMTSDMPQIVSSLPAPYDKKLNQGRSFSLLSEGNQLNSEVNLKWGDNLSFKGFLPHELNQFSRAHLSLGKQQVFDMGSGFSVSANLAQADFDNWIEVIDIFAQTSGAQTDPSAKKSLLPAPARVTLEVESVDFLGQQFSKLDMEFRKRADHWLAEVAADEIRGELLLFDDWLERGVVLNADYLYIKQSENEDKEQPTSSELAAQLPPFILKCLKCNFLGTDLGRVDLELSRNEQGMSIDRLLVEKGQDRLNAKGQWYLADNAQSSYLKGEVSSKEIGNMFKSLGFETGIKDSKGWIQYDLSWQGAPYDFNLDSLSGDVSWRFGEGYLADLSDKGSRLFSLLSLDSLVRKLKLDFRDVFSKGFFYNKITGDIKLQDGIAYTDNARIDGIPGDMRIKGNTNLVAQDLNYRVSFKPKVTSSIPIIVAWMVNPATGLAALALDEVIQSAEVVAEINYSITGTIEEPILTELGRKSREVSLPAQTRPPVPKEPLEKPVILGEPASIKESKS